MTGVRTELAVENPSTCPVARASTEFDGPATDVTWTGEDGSVTEQFTAPGTDGVEDFETAFDYGTRRVYEFERDATDPCVCEFIQESLGPVTEVHARDGTLHVTIHAPDVDRLRETIVDLREQFGAVSMEYLVGSREDDDGEVVPVDLGRLTDRQREVIETAHGMGYFDYPREANATEVAETLGIDPSTFAEHLGAAQAKLFEELLAVEA